MADATLIAAIRKAASQTGADPVLMVATSLVESGATWYPSPGDNNTSFGPFQFHIGGALGSHTPAWASTWAAILNRAQAFAGALSPTDAARIQGPANPTAYAAAVAAQIPTARQLLASVPASTPITPTSSGASAGKVPAPGAAVAAIATTQEGVPYSWDGGTLAGPSLGAGTGAGTVGFDCSGLVLWAFGQLGIVLPHNAAAQYALGTPVAEANLQPGDALFFEPDKSGAPQHEGLYIGNGQFVAAPHTGAKVATFNLSDRTDYIGARRFVSNATVDRSGSLVAAVPGRQQAADSVSLSNNWGTAMAKLLKIGSPAGLGLPSIPNLPSLDPQHYANEAVAAALGPVGDAITSAESSAESFITGNVAHAAIWVALVGGALALIVIGTHRAVAPDSHPLQNLKEGEMPLAEMAAA